MKAPHLLKYLASALLFYFASFSHSECQDTLSGLNIKFVEKIVENEKYTEGIYALPVSSALELISFTGFLPDELKRQKELFVEFYAPDSGQIQIIAQEKKVFDFYIMLSKPSEPEAGNNVFGPWSLGVLNDFEVTPNNLGILLRYQELNGKHLLPAIVYSGFKPARVENYTASFRIEKHISRGELTVCKGEHPGAALPANRLVHSNLLGRHFAGRILQVNIPREKLDNYDGWVTVNLKLRIRNSTEAINERFYFYHHSF